MITPAEKLARLRLLRTENIGPITFYKMLERFGTAEKALEALPDFAKRGGKTLTAFPRAAAIEEVERAKAFGADYIFHDEPLYPKLLREIEDAPPIITVMGNAALLSKPSLGVVGARNASLAGRKVAEDFSRKTGAAGFSIVSGLARGIDTAAHTASLGTGTVAVVAGGIDVIYPPENEKLYRAIAENGVIVAESPFGTEPIARHFPKRNRIISGLSLGVLVVEAAMKSGSLITARMAAEQNREVFAVPGSPLDPRSEGTNKLIQDGAHLVTSAEDILQVLRDLRRQPLREDAAPFLHAPLLQGAADDNLRTRLLELLSSAPTAQDEIIRASGARPGDVLTALLELELAGRVERQPGGRICLL